MKKVIVGGEEFVLLEPDEIDCEHGGWRLVYEEIVINPNGEFVQGYGSSLVIVHGQVTGERCAFCKYVRRVEK